MRIHTRNTSVTNYFLPNGPFFCEYCLYAHMYAHARIRTFIWFSAKLSLRLQTYLFRHLYTIHSKCFVYSKETSFSTKQDFLSTYFVITLKSLILFHYFLSNLRYLWLKLKFSIKILFLLFRHKLYHHGQLHCSEIVS